MTVRARYSIAIQISSDPTVEDKDLGNAAYEVVSDEYGEGGIREFTLAAGASDVEVALGNVASGSLLSIRTRARDALQTPNAITIKLNGVGSEEITVAPLSETAEGHFVLSTSGLTSLHASNGGSVDMKLAVAVVGD